MAREIKTAELSIVYSMYIHVYALLIVLTYRAASNLRSASSMFPVVI